MAQFIVCKLINAQVTCHT